MTIAAITGNTMAFKPYCNSCQTWHTEQEDHMETEFDAAYVELPKANAEIKRLRDGIIAIKCHLYAQNEMTNQRIIQECRDLCDHILGTV